MIRYINIIASDINKTLFFYKAANSMMYVGKNERPRLAIKNFEIVASFCQLEKSLFSGNRVG